MAGEAFADGGVMSHTTILSDASDDLGVAAISDGVAECTFTTLDVYAMSPYEYDASLCVGNPACGNV